MKRPEDRQIRAGADDPDIAANVAQMQERARNRDQAPKSAAFGSFVGCVFVMLVYAVILVALLAAFVGLYRLAAWLLGAL